MEWYHELTLIKSNEMFQYKNSFYSKWYLCLQMHDDDDRKYFMSIINMWYNKWIKWMALRLDTLINKKTFFFFKYKFIINSIKDNNI